MSSSPISRETSTAQFFSIKLSNALDELATLSRWINDVVDQTNTSKEFGFKLNLALEEAVTNIIQHGFVDNQQGCIEIKVSLDGQKMAIDMRDDGIPFNPLEDHTILIPDNLEDAAVGGLGIHLIKNYVDNISYQRTEEKNILTFCLTDNL